MKDKNYVTQHVSYCSGRRMSLKSYEANSQWELLGVTIENKTRTAKTSIEVEYDYLEYTLRMKRKPHFYVYTIILPCLCLTCKLIPNLFEKLLKLFHAFNVSANDLIFNRIEFRGLQRSRTNTHFLERILQAEKCISLKDLARKFLNTRQ